MKNSKNVNGTKAIGLKFRDDINADHAWLMIYSNMPKDGGRCIAKYCMDEKMMEWLREQLNIILGYSVEEPDDKGLRIVVDE